MAVRRGPPLAYAHRSILRNAESLASAAIPIRHTSLCRISNSVSSLLNVRPCTFILRTQTGSRMKEAPTLSTKRSHHQPQHVADRETHLWGLSPLRRIQFPSPK